MDLIEAKVAEGESGLEFPEVIFREMAIDVPAGGQVTAQFEPLDIDPHRYIGSSLEVIPDPTYRHRYTLLQRVAVMSEQQFEDHLAAHEKMKAEMQAAIFEQIEDEVDDA